MTDFTIVSVSSPVYANEQNTAINCMVQFADPKFTAPVPYTAASHDPENHGQTLWAALLAGSYGAIEPYVAPTLSPAQQVKAAIASGIVVTSTADSTLNGTYPVDPATQVKLNSAITYIMMNNAFPPASATSLPWYDAAGNVHTFTSIATFKAFATAFADYVAHLDIYVNSSGASGSIPANAVTIP